MSETFELTVEVREDKGKGASRRLRRLSDRIPAIIYGGDQPPQPLSIIRKDLEKALETEAFYSSILSLQLDGKTEKAILKDLQRHPSKDRVMHADFLRVSANVAIKISVPLHFINEDEAPGVKLEGGIVQYAITELEISCLPGDIPEYIEVDLGALNIGDNVHLTDIKMPAGVDSTALDMGEAQDLLVASVVAPRAVAAEDTETDEEAPAAGDVPTASDEQAADDADGGDDSED
ncbi:MAG: 50S ribosomal protein L25/general stress protein Ctc [Halieaceae bacterium]|jgi:large subunit ribosomal protein L25|nr:50S ribosomal protein L25/general stress protein Ctc [Halieaceae bacterium]